MFGKKSQKTETTVSHKKRTRTQSVKQFQPAKYKIMNTGNILHESGLILEKDDTIMQDFKISAPDGDGWLVITFRRAYVVIKNKGTHLFLEWIHITDFEIKGNNLVIIWHENFDSRYQYTVKILNNRVTEAEKMFLVHCSFLNEARYAPIPAEERDMIRRGRIEEQRNKVRALEDELDDLRKKLAVLVNEFEPKQMINIVDIPRSEHRIKHEDNIIIELEDKINQCSHTGDGSWSQTEHAYVSEAGQIIKRIEKIEAVMELERVNLYFVSFDTIQRSPLIPAEIESKDVWYDMYYDAKHKAYVSILDMYPSFQDLEKIRKDMKMPYGCGFTPWPARRIETMFGQPALRHFSMSANMLKTAWFNIPTLGIENYHYMRFLGEYTPNLHGNYYCQITPNSGWNGMYPKEFIRLYMRLGKRPTWAQEALTPLDVETLEEEIQLAKEGNVNYMSLVFEDTPYADKEDISCMPYVEQMQGKIGLDLITFDR